MMADHMEEPPQKRVKMDELFLLEENLPDELVSTWGDPGTGPPSGPPNHGLGVNVVGGPNKPPAQGPGPGGPGSQLNGSVDDGSVTNQGGASGGGNPLRQMQHHQHLQHLLQQQVIIFVYNTYSLKTFCYLIPLFIYSVSFFLYRVIKIQEWLAILWAQVA